MGSAGKVQTMISLLAEMYARMHQALNLRLRTFAGGHWASWCRPTSIAILLTEALQRTVHALRHLEKPRQRRSADA